jgi:hypothetical protein
MFRLLLLSIWILFHPVHVTLTSIDYVPEENSFKVFIRMYFDDFLKDCKLEGGENQNKGFLENNSCSLDVMEKYLKEKVLIKVNTKLLSGKIIEMKLVDNEISMRVEYATALKPEVITVKNLIMTELYSDMTNMLILKINDFEEGLTLTSDLTERTFKIK